MVPETKDRAVQYDAASKPLPGIEKNFKKR